MKLIYIGRDGAYLPGVPASDHEEDDPEQVQVKLSSGIYRTESGEEVKQREHHFREAKNQANEQAAAAAQAHAAKLTTLADEAAAEAAETARVAAEIAAEAEKASRQALARQSAVKGKGGK